MLEIPREIQGALANIGLDRTEQQICLQLLGSGLMSIQELSATLNLPRSSVHLATESLLSRGVLKVQVTGKRRSFYISEPKDLGAFLAYEENALRAKQSALQSVMPRLTARFATAKDAEPIDIEELQGEDGLVETFYRSLDLPRGGEVLRFGGDPARFTVARDKLATYREKRVKKRIHSRILMPDLPMAKDEIRDARGKMREVKALPKELYNPNTQASVFGNTVTMTVWDKGLHSVIITNKAIAGMMRELFEIAWSQAQGE